MWSTQATKSNGQPTNYPLEGPTKRQCSDLKGSVLAFFYVNSLDEMPAKVGLHPMVRDAVVT